MKMYTWALLEVLLAATAVDSVPVASPAEHLGSGAVGSVTSPAEHLGSGAVGIVARLRGNFRTPLQSDAATNTTSTRCGVAIGQDARGSIRLAGRRAFSMSNFPAESLAQIEHYMSRVVGGACEKNETKATGKATVCRKNETKAIGKATDIFGGGGLGHDLAPPWNLAGWSGKSWGISIVAAMQLIAEARLQPLQIPLSEVCQKGMADRDHMWRFTAAPESGQVNLRVDATQIETTCGVKLTESRCGHLCLDAPVIVVKTTQNPCQARYRVIDGAHRLCVLVATMLAGAGTNTDRSGRQVHLGSVGYAVPTVPAFVLSEADVMEGSYNLLRWDVCHKDAPSDAARHHDKTLDQEYRREHADVPSIHEVYPAHPKLGWSQDERLCRAIKKVRDEQGDLSNIKRQMDVIKALEEEKVKLCKEEERLSHETEKLSQRVNATETRGEKTMDLGVGAAGGSRLRQGEQHDLSMIKQLGERLSKITKKQRGLLHQMLEKLSKKQAPRK